MTKYIFPLIALIIMLTACNDGQKKVAEYTKEVMVVHDEAMAEMGTIETLKKELNKQLEEGNTNGTLDSASVVQLHATIDALSTAYDGMMDWMHDYEAPKDMEPEAAMEYLKGQMTSIQEVNKDVKESIAQAKQLLRNE